MEGYAHLVANIAMAIAMCYDGLNQRSFVQIFSPFIFSLYFHSCVSPALERLLSLLGSRWKAAAAVCLILALDGFRMYYYVVAHAFRLVIYITCKQYAYT
jgi:hypothetical protein